MSDGFANCGEVNEQDWRVVDGRLRVLAEERGRLDAEEAKWLRAAERLQIWREVGCVSMHDYLEKRLGYQPHTVNERLRTARCLGKLPELEKKLESGELPFSGVRELTRVMTPETEQEWIKEADGKSVREIEDLVKGHEPGDLPTDPPKPELVRERLRYEVNPATYALVRQAKAALEKERGERLDDDQFLTAMCTAVLEGGVGDGDAKAERNGRAKFQIAVTTCLSCKGGVQRGAGEQVHLTTAEVERAQCDAQRVGSLDEPRKATQDVPPRVRRFVFNRDGDRCTVPGCRSTRYVEIHHIKAREHGGGHEPENLTLLCDAHHTRLHEGQITLEGKAPDQLVFTRRHEPGVRVVGKQSHVGPKSASSHVGSKLDQVTLIVNAKAALAKLGYSRDRAAAAIQAATVRIGRDVSLDTLVRAAIEVARTT